MYKFACQWPTIIEQRNGTWKNKTQIYSYFSPWFSQNFFLLLLNNKGINKKIDKSVSNSLIAFITWGIQMSLLYKSRDYINIVLYMCVCVCYFLSSYSFFHANYIKSIIYLVSMLHNNQNLKQINVEITNKCRNIKNVLLHNPFKLQKLLWNKN